MLQTRQSARGVSQDFRDGQAYGDADELPRSTSLAANSLTRTLLAASRRHPSGLLSKEMQTTGRAAKTFAKDFNETPLRKTYDKPPGQPKTREAGVVTQQLAVIYHSLKGPSGLDVTRLGDAVAALDVKYAPPTGAAHPHEAAITFLTDLAIDPSQTLDEDAFVGIVARIRPQALKKAAGRKATRTLQQRLKADPFAIMRRKQSRANAFDFQKEARTGQALADVTRLADEAKAKHASAESVWLAADKKDERRRERTLQRLEIKAIKADEKDLRKWKREDEVRKREVQEQLAKAQKDGLTDGAASALLAAIPALRPRPVDPLPMPRKEPAHRRLQRTLEGNEVADRADRSRFEAANRSYYEPEVTATRKASALPAAPVDHVTRNASAFAQASGGRVPLLDAITLELDSKSKTVNLAKREELELRLELPMRNGFDVDAATVGLPSNWDARDVKAIRHPPAGAASAAPRGGPREAVVQEQRRAENEAILKRKAEAKLAKRVAVAIAKIQKRGVLDRLDEGKREELEQAMALVDLGRKEEYEREEKIHAARELVRDEKASERRRLKEELHTNVALIRGSERDRVLGLRERTQPFAMTPGIFDSRIPPENAQSRQKRQDAQLLSEWRSSVEEERSRVRDIRSANLAKYFEERSSPYIGEPSEWRERGSPVRTASSLVDGTGHFREERVEAASELYPTFSRASCASAPDPRGSRVDSWTVADGQGRSHAVTPAALPPAMVSADRIFRGARRPATVRL